MSAIPVVDDLSTPFDAAIAACNECATACDACAVACLAEQHAHAMAACVRNDIDCAAVCRLAAGAMARRSDNVMVICKLCAAICHACAAECRKHEAHHCRACADRCEACEAACLAVIQ